MPEAVSLRHDGSLDIREVEDIAAATAAEVRTALTYEGSIGVIAADAAIDRLTAVLRAEGVAVTIQGVEDDSDVDLARVILLPASLAKGLEYDHVIVVEPAEIVSAEPRGLNRLYVVLTRAVSRLSILHNRPLPALMTA